MTAQGRLQCQREQCSVRESKGRYEVRERRYLQSESAMMGVTWEI